MTSPAFLIKAALDPLTVGLMAKPFLAHGGLELYRQSQNPEESRQDRKPRIGKALLALAYGGAGVVAGKLLAGRLVRPWVDKIVNRYGPVFAPPGLGGRLWNTRTIANWALSLPGGAVGSVLGLKLKNLIHGDPRAEQK